MDNFREDYHIFCPLIMQLFSAVLYSLPYFPGKSLPRPSSFHLSFIRKAVFVTVKSHKLSSKLNSIFLQ